jgi:hypothetical protein
MRSTQQTARLFLETLDERLVPSTVDLTTRGSEAAVGDAIVRQTDAQPTGTGYIKSFVRIQGAAKGGAAEQGYNTTARPLQFDENKSPSFTRALTAGEVPTTTVNGVIYREFLLDINQKGSASKLSVDDVRIYLGDRPDLVGYDAAGKTLAGLSPVFDLNPNDDGNHVLLDARLNSGSGSGDMVLLVPNSAFAGATLGTYVYLYSKMGELAGATANSGFEEWAVPAHGAPAAGTGSLSGFVYEDDNDDGVIDAGEAGIAGVTITLNGTDDLGRTVVLTTTTDASGAYSFTNLRPGVYTILEQQPDGYVDGKDTLGSLGGEQGDDKFFNIYLGDGQSGEWYNFAELLPDNDGGLPGF